MRGLHIGPAKPWRCVHAQPHPGHTNSKLEKIHLAQPALHRLGTEEEEEAASKGRPEKQGWRRGRGSSSRSHQQPWMCLYRGIWGRGGTKQPNNSAGGLSGAAHLAQAEGYPTKIKILEIKELSLRGLVQHILSPVSRSLPSPAEPTRGSQAQGGHPRAAQPPQLGVLRAPGKALGAQESSSVGPWAS